MKGKAPHRKAKAPETADSLGFEVDFSMRPRIDLGLVIRRHNNLILVGAERPETPAWGLLYFTCIKHIAFNALSLECDRRIQPALTAACQQERKLSFWELPGFAWAFNHAINTKVPVFASGRVRDLRTASKVSWRLKSLQQNHGTTVYLCSTSSVTEVMACL